MRTCSGGTYYFEGDATVVCLDDRGALESVLLVTTQAKRPDLIEEIAIVQLGPRLFSVKTIDFRSKDRDDKVVVCKPSGEAKVVASGLDSVADYLQILRERFHDDGQGFIVHGSMAAPGIGFAELYSVVTDKERTEETASGRYSGAVAASMAMLIGHSRADHKQGSRFTGWPCKHEGAVLCPPV